MEELEIRELRKRSQDAVIRLFGMPPKELLTYEPKSVLEEMVRQDCRCSLEAADGRLQGRERRRGR
jgi:hypothetical protein